MSLYLSMKMFTSIKPLVYLLCQASAECVPSRQCRMLCTRPLFHMSSTTGGFLRPPLALSRCSEHRRIEFRYLRTAAPRVTETFADSCSLFYSWLYCVNIEVLYDSCSLFYCQLYCVLIEAFRVSSSLPCSWLYCFIIETKQSFSVYFIHCKQSLQKLCKSKWMIPIMFSSLTFVYKQF